MIATAQQPLSRLLIGLDPLEKKVDINHLIAARRRLLQADFISYMVIAWGCDRVRALQIYEATFNT